MFKAIKEAFRTHEPTIFFRVGSSPLVEISVFEKQLHSFTDPARNLAEAQRSGIQPVNFMHLREQFNIEQLSGSVLFDSAPGPFPGNHWRILSMDDESDRVTIQLCGPFGNYDARIPPFNVSQYDILFTGISIPEYMSHGHTITLGEVVEKVLQAGYGKGNLVYPKDIEFKGETIYWADANGKLAPTGSRLINTTVSPQAHGKG